MSAAPVLFDAQRDDSNLQVPTKEEESKSASLLHTKKRIKSKMSLTMYPELKILVVR